MKILLLTLLFFIFQNEVSSEKTFQIDYDNDQFLKDGKPFRYVSGSIHYFRVPAVLWKDRLMKAKAGGLNAIEFVIEWNSHNPEPDVYDFEDNLDLVKFIETAQEVGLLVIIRPGPYTCAERDNGGLPYWLMNINPNMKLRSSDPQFVAQYEKWYSVLMPKLAPLMYHRGGPIIMTQIENEYGAYGCDEKYKTHLRDLFHSYLGNQSVLFTTDPVSVLKCGKVENVFATVDFGVHVDINDVYKKLRSFQKSGPFVNSELYPAWLDQWELKHNTIDAKTLCDFTDKLLATNASLSLYMYHGGTSFGFGNGASYVSSKDNEIFQVQVTSYDYDAPLDEAGDPIDKYFCLRKVIGKYLPLSSDPLPTPQPKMQLPPIAMKPIKDIFDEESKMSPINSLFPFSFAQLEQRKGFILYSTNITFTPSDPSMLTITGLADRAQVFVDKQYQGTLSRMERIYSLPIDVSKGSRLDIFIENQGGVNFGEALGERKGMKNATIGSHTLTNWNQFLFYKNWEEKVASVEQETAVSLPQKNIPMFFSGTFKLPENITQPMDTYLRLDGWRKGVAFLNGFNLGRYWPVAGPQVTLYAPAYLFRGDQKENTLTLFELEGSPCERLNEGKCTAQFVNKPELNGTIPNSNLRPANSYYSNQQKYSEST